MAVVVPIAWAAWQIALLVGGTSLASSVVSSGLTAIFMKAKEKVISKQEVIQLKKLVEDSYTKWVLDKYQFKKFIQDKQGKKHICFLGPTSVGKTTLCNELFNTKHQVGLGDTTKEATMVHQNKNKVYWDARGTSSDWTEYLDQDLNFFKDLDQVFILFNGKISQIYYLASLLEKFKKQIIFVRTKCDEWKSGMKPIDTVLQEDIAFLKEKKMKNQTVIPIGKGMLNEIKKYI